MYDALVFDTSNHFYPEGGSKGSKKQKSGDETKGSQLHCERPGVELHRQQTKATCGSGKRWRGAQSSKQVTMIMCEGVTSGCNVCLCAHNVQGSSTNNETGRFSQFHPFIATGLLLLH